MLWAGSEAARREVLLDDLPEGAVSFGAGDFFGHVIGAGILDAAPAGGIEAGHGGNPCVHVGLGDGHAAEQVAGR